MADVFISYSRRDEQFVQRLRETLAENGKDVWVDREDIGPAVQWRREIELGIEGSDMFAFVITPDALESEPCQRELEYAEAKKKRIVPLLRREPGELPVPDDLASRNYIFFRTEAEFAPGLTGLLAAIDNLPEWAREHTRLLERAEEWEHNDRDASFLLRGTDLRDAERWLSEQSAHKEPQPTPLQIEYALGSRKAATRRQRLTTGGVLLALGVAVILAVVAVIQRNEAEKQRDEAVRQAQVAESRRLAAVSIGEVQADPWEALELAIRARETSDTPEATDALRLALETPRESAVLELPRIDITTARFTPDSEHIRTTSEDGKVRLWNLATGEFEIVRTQTEPPLRYSTPNDVSPDRALRLTADPFAVRLSDAEAGNPLIELNRLGGGIEGANRTAQFSPDGNSFLTAGYDSTVRVWPLTLRRLAASQVAGAAISPDGRRCLTAQGDGVDDVATLWSCDDGEERRRWTIPPESLFGDRFFPGDFLPVSFNADGSKIAVRVGSGTTVSDAETGEELLRLRAHGIHSPPTISLGGSLAIRGLSYRSAEIVELPGENPAGRLPPDYPFYGHVAFSEDDRRGVFADRNDQLVRVWDFVSGEEIATIGPFDHPVEDVDLSADGSLVLTASDTSVEFWDADGGERARGFAAPQLVFTAAFAADERFVVTGGSDGSVRVWEASTGRPVAAHVVAPRDVGDASMAADGRLLAIGAKQSAIVIDCAACQAPAAVLADARAAIEDRPALPE